MLLRGLAGTYGYEFVILRYMNVYGPGQRAGVVPAVARALLAGATPTLTGDGTQSFDFVHIDDCARANTSRSRRPPKRRVVTSAAATLRRSTRSSHDVRPAGRRDHRPHYQGSRVCPGSRVGDVAKLAT